MMPFLRVYLVRHGESSNNVLLDVSATSYYGGRSADAGLTDRGVGQADTVAAHFAAKKTVTHPPITQVYASPMARAVDTGAAIAAGLHLPLRVWPAVCEVGGLFDLRSKAAVEEDRPEEVADPRATIPGSYGSSGKIAVGVPGLTASQLRTRFAGSASRFPSLEVSLPADGSVTEAGWWLKSFRETPLEAEERTQGVLARLKAWAAALPSLTQEHTEKGASPTSATVPPAARLAQSIDLRDSYTPPSSPHAISSGEKSHSEREGDTITESAAADSEVAAGAAFDTPELHGTPEEQTRIRNADDDNSISIVIVCHGDFIDHMLGLVAGVGRGIGRFCHNNCAHSVFDVFPNGHTRILCINDVSYFKEAGKQNLITGAPKW